MANLKDIPKLKTRARVIFAHLVQGMQPGTSKRVDNSNGTYVPLSVERTTETEFSLTHYIEQNGDLMKDPDMLFFRTPEGDFIPLYFQNDMAGSVYREAVTYRDDGSWFVDMRECREQCEFAAMWLNNIVDQQELRV